MASEGGEPSPEVPQPVSRPDVAIQAEQLRSEGPGDPKVLIPWQVAVVALLWTIVLVALFFCYEEVKAVADFFPGKFGPLPIEAIWFGAVGGLLISLDGIFRYNREWRRSYDYWHYMRPVVGAIIGALGCLVFIVLTEAATKGAPAKVNPVFYDVIALAVGYREASFRSLIERLIDAVILPADKRSATKTVTDKPSVEETHPDA